MEKRSKRLARLALLAALGVVFLVLANVLPAGRLALLALASFPVCMTLMMYGRGWALAVFGVTAMLGCLVLPGASAAAYLIFFGYYPILKSVLERLRNMRLSWILKFAAYTAALLLYWLVARFLFVGDAEMKLSWLLFFGGAAAFFVYDYAYSVLIRFYIEKIARYFS